MPENPSRVVLNIQDLERMYSFYMAVNRNGLVTWASQAFKKRYKEATGIAISQILEVAGTDRELDVIFIKSICGKQQVFLLKGLGNRIIGEWLESEAGFILLAVPELLTKEDLQNFCLSDFPAGDLQVNIMSLKDEASASMREASLAAKSLKEKNKELANSAKHLMAEIQERQKAEEELFRINQIYDFLSQVNQMLVRTASRKELFDLICRIAVKRGKFLLALIGLVKSESRVVPVAWASARNDLIGDVRVFLDEQHEENDLISLSVSRGVCVVCNDIADNSKELPWRQKAEKAGIRSLAVFPIRLRGAVLGVLAVHAANRDYFREKEVAVIKEIAMDISFGLDRMEDEKERIEAEKKLRESEEQYRALFESSRDAIMTLSPSTWKFTSANQATVRLFGAESEDQFTALGPGDVSPENQPDGTSSSVKAPQMIMQAMRDGSNFFEWTHKRINGNIFPATVLLTRMEWGGEPFLQATVRDVSEQKLAEGALRKLTRAVEQNPSSVVITDPDGVIEYVNPKFSAVTGYTMEEVLRQNQRILKSGDTPAETYREMWKTIKDGKEWRGEVHNRKKNGELFWEWISISPITDDFGKIASFVAVKEDITERKRLETELMHARKLESVGQLAAGIAHEINTPIQFVGDNARFLKDSFEELQGLLTKFRKMQSVVTEKGCAPELAEEIRTAVEAADLDYLAAEIPKAIDQTLEGVQRVAKIVRAMKEFSHPDEGIEKVLTDINRAIETTVTVARNEWKYVSDVKTELDPALPPVHCLPGDINQVFLNLIVNAAHAIADRKNPNNEKGTITISTKPDDKWVEIRISDTGTGIPEKNRSRIFEPFFTTKGVGRGTGQGLTISHNVVVKKHGGTISFEAEEGMGTTFIVRLPVGRVVA